MGDQVKPDAEVVTHNALGHVLDHPHVQVRTTYFKDSSRTGVAHAVEVPFTQSVSINAATTLQ